MPEIMILEELHVVTFNNTYWTGSNPGDRTTPIAGQLTSLTSLNQAYGIRNTGISLSAARGSR